MEEKQYLCLFEFILELSIYVFWILPQFLLCPTVVVPPSLLSIWNSRTDTILYIFFQPFCSNYQLFRLKSVINIYNTIHKVRWNSLRTEFTIQKQSKWQGEQFAIYDCFTRHFLTELRPWIALTPPLVAWTYMLSPPVHFLIFPSQTSSHSLHKKELKELTYCIYQLLKEKIPVQ
jgi:hypothetical protein